LAGRAYKSDLTKGRTSNPDLIGKHSLPRVYKRQESEIQWSNWTQERKRTINAEGTKRNEGQGKVETQVGQTITPQSAGCDVIVAKGAFRILLTRAAHADYH